MKRLSLFLIWIACVFAGGLIAIRMLWCVAFNKQKAIDIAIGLDRAANGAGNGRITETISSRANRARAENRRWGCVLCRWLDWLDPDHCNKAAGQ